MWIALLVTGIFYVMYWFYQQMKAEPLQFPIQVILGLDTPPSAIFFVKDTADDTPVDFYYKSTWLRVKSKDSIAVQVEIDRILANIASTSQPQQRTSEKWVLTTVEDWIVVSSSDLPSPEDNDGILILKQLMQKLSAMFVEVHYLGNHRTVDYYAWAKAVEGELIRAYAYIGKAEEPLWEEGSLTPEEKQLELDFRDSGRIVEWEDDIERIAPNEQSVIMIAAAWRASSVLSA